MTRLEPAGLLLGRCLLALLFVHEGLAKLMAYDGAVTDARGYGVPEIFLDGAIALELGGGMLLLAGLGTRAIALFLAIFCIAAAAIFHNKLGDGGQLLHFEKDIAIVGGFLVLGCRGAGSWALDPVLDGWRTRGQSAPPN